jgi:hypothetical protein
LFNFPEIKEIYPYRYYDIMMSKAEFYQGNKIDASEYRLIEDQDSFSSKN